MSGTIIPFPRPWKKTNVRCYSGYRADEYPTFITGDKGWLRIEEILDRWYDQDHSYFKIRTQEDKIYLLKWAMEEDTWWIKPL